MICPHCKKMNYNEKAEICAYCKGDMHAKPVETEPVVETIETTQPEIVEKPTEEKAMQNSQVEQAIEQPEKAEKEPESKKPKKEKKKMSGKKKAITSIVILLCLIVAGLVGGFIYFNDIYNSAIRSSDPIFSYEQFEKISWYKDSSKKMEEQKDNILKAALKAIDEKNVELAENYLNFLGDYNGVAEAREKLEEAKIENIYDRAVICFEAGRYNEAKTNFEKVPGYKDSDEYLNRLPFKFGEHYYTSLSYAEAEYQHIPFVQLSFGKDDHLYYSKDGDLHIYTYAIVESDEDYTCSFGEYEIWLVSEVIDGKEYTGNFAQGIIGINKVKINSDGIIEQFYSNGVLYLCSDLEK